MGAILGIILHAIGGFAAGSFYAPYKRVKNWAWEIYWLLGGVFAWLIMPWLISYMAIPNLYSFMRVQNSLNPSVYIFPNDSRQFSIK